MTSCEPPKLRANASNEFHWHMLNRISDQNPDIAQYGSSQFEQFMSLMTISRKFFGLTLINCPMILHVGIEDLELSHDQYLLDVYYKTAAIEGMLLKKKQLDNLLTLAQPFGVEFYGIPLAFVPNSLGKENGTANLDPAYFRFFHHIERGQFLPFMLRNYGDQPLSISTLPSIFQGRTALVPYFYSHALDSFPPTEPTYVYLPKLFLETSYRLCRNASFSVLISDSDKFEPGKMRKLFSLKRQLGAARIKNIFGESCFNRVNIVECEGLTFSTMPKMAVNPMSNVLQHAFKVSDDKLRVLIVVNCNAHGVSLIDHCIQTARVYMSLLSEMPSLKSFDVAVLVNVNRSARVSGVPFAFLDTVASKLDDNMPDDSVHSVQLLREQRPDLQWFTDMCAPHSAYCAFGRALYPQTRCMWLVDVNPSRPNAIQ